MTEVHPEVYRHDILIESNRPDQEQPRVWYARCRCGWIGVHRFSQTAADEDGSAHIQAAIPNDMPGSQYH